ncbi:MAG: sel1 repeat family protein [Bacteriovoracaceae bacterium]|nr:sel1 repeat family protein [Bacteriovoracaceae bacterium]
MNIKLELMEINEINPKKLKADEQEQTLWYRGDKGDLFIIFTADRITHFEVTIDDKHIEGGHSRTMRYGIVDPDEHVKDALQFKKSRMVQFNEEIPKGFIDETIEVVFASKNLETLMKEGIMLFLSSGGANDTGLKLESGQYESLREIVPKPFDFSSFLSKWWKTGLGVFILLIMANFIYEYIYKNKIELACKKGSTVACANLGMLNSLKGRSNPNQVWINTISSGREQKKKDCDEGMIESCYEYYDEMIALNKFEKSVLNKLHVKACDQGIARGCYVLGKEEFFQGNVDKAVKFFEKSCLKNHLDSCELVLNEKKYTFNLEECSNGDNEACYLVALKEIGEGKTKEAESRLEMSCEAGHAPSCSKLANLLIRKKQVGKAQSLYHKSCKMNDMTSCFNYRHMTSRNKEERKFALNLLKDCQKGNEKACIRLKKID